VCSEECGGASPRFLSGSSNLEILWWVWLLIVLLFGLLFCFACYVAREHRTVKAQVTYVDGQDECKEEPDDVCNHHSEFLDVVPGSADAIDEQHENECLIRSKRTACELREEVDVCLPGEVRNTSPEVATSDVPKPGSPRYHKIQQMAEDHLRLMLENGTATELASAIECAREKGISADQLWYAEACRRRCAALEQVRNFVSPDETGQPLKKTWRRLMCWKMSALNSLVHQAEHDPAAVMDVLYKSVGIKIRCHR